jgi:large subunit ribosomal protein L24
MKKLHKGDQVVVLSGKDKGRKGAITRMLPDGKVLVEGVNLVKKHQRPNPQRQQAAGIVEKEMPLHASKVAIWNSGSSKADRIGVKSLADGKRVRFL